MLDIINLNIIIYIVISFNDPKWASSEVKHLKYISQTIYKMYIDMFLTQLHMDL